jgi:hypothetical protein
MEAGVLGILFCDILLSEANAFRPSKIPAIFVSPELILDSTNTAKLDNPALFNPRVVDKSELIPGATKTAR